MWQLSIDSREQDGLNIKPGANIETVTIEKLPFGDYAGKANKDAPFWPVFWERKNLGDLFGTLTNGIERFKKEIARAKESNITMYLGIEASLKDVYSGYAHSSVLGSTIVKTLFTFKLKYGIEPVFCNGRDELKYQIIETYDALDRHYYGRMTKGNLSNISATEEIPSIPVTEPMASFGSDIMPQEND